MKEKKAISVTEQALKSTERKTMQQLHQAQVF